MPKGLDPVHIRKAVEYIEDKAGELVELYHAQANVFSGIVGMFGIVALDSFSPYKKHKHPDVAQQRFPDLSLGGKLSPPPIEALESKGSLRPWAVQSHYDHPGWYVIWRYHVDPTRTMKKGREVVIWRVDVVYVNKTDWKYEGSKAKEGAGGRTHTFGLKEAAKKLDGAAVYLLPGVVLRGGKPVIAKDAE